MKGQLAQEMGAHLASMAHVKFAWPAEKLSLE